MTVWFGRTGLAVRDCLTERSSRSLKVSGPRHWLETCFLFLLVLAWTPTTLILWGNGCSHSHAVSVSAVLNSTICRLTGVGYRTLSRLMTVRSLRIERLRALYTKNELPFFLFGPPPWSLCKGRDSSPYSSGYEAKGVDPRSFRSSVRPRCRWLLLTSWSVGVVVAPEVGPSLVEIFLLVLSAIYESGC